MFDTRELGRIICGRPESCGASKFRTLCACGLQPVDRSETNSHGAISMQTNVDDFTVENRN